MAEVVLENVSKTFAGGVAALRDVSLAIGDGELIAIVGPSGCGKTTTLRSIAGLERPESGTIRIGGQVVDHLPPQDRDVAMVFQDHALYPHLSVRQNLAFGLRTRRVPRVEIDRRVAEAADLLGIADLLERKPSALSGGQQQRVAVGRVVVRHPRCALLDEPLSNLDARLRLRMRAELKSLHRRLGTTTIHVTHDQAEAMTLGDRLAVMHDGRLQQTGRPLDVYRRPANRFVAGFLGSPPMNLLAGRLERTNGTLRFTDRHDVSVPVPADETLAWHVGKNVLLGVRPEHLRAGAARTTDAATLSVRVDVVERLGDRTDVHAETAAGAPIVARAEPACKCRPDERLTLHVAADAVHLFEAGPAGLRIGEPTFARTESPKDGGPP